MNLTIDELKKILELCGIIAINNNIVKFVKSTSGYGGNYSWSMFLLENSLINDYFFQMNLSRYNKKYPRNNYFIGLESEGDTIINSSTQFQYKKLKYTKLNRLLRQKVNKMKYILQLNNYLKKSIVEEKEFSNDRSFSQNVLPTSTIDNYLTLNFIKNKILKMISKKIAL